MVFDKYISKIKGNKTLVNGGLFSFFSFINRGISFLLLILLANYIMPAEYGVLSLFNTVVSFAAYFIALCTQGYLSISFFKSDKEGFRKDVSSIYLITVSSLIVLSCMVLLFGGKLGGWLNLPSVFIWIALIICFFNVFWELFIDFVRVQEKVLKYGILSISFALLNFGLTLYLVINRDLNWEGRVYAQLATTILFAVLGIVIFLKKGLITFNLTWDRVRFIILWGLPLIPHNAANWLKQGGDRMIINQTFGVEEVGIFSFALNLVGLIIMIGVAFNSSNSVTIFQILSSDANNKWEQLKKQTKNIFIIYLFTILAIVLGVSIFVPLLLPKYSACIPYFLILSVYGFLQCIYFLYCNYLFYYNKNKEIMLITFGTASLHLLLSLLLTRYSLYLTCIIYLITQFILVYFVSNRSKIVLKQNNII